MASCPPVSETTSYIPREWCRRLSMIARQQAVIGQLPGRPGLPMKRVALQMQVLLGASVSKLGHKVFHHQSLRQKAMPQNLQNN